MGNNVKRLAILGATGSIGQQTLDVVRSVPNRFQVVGLGAGRNAALLAKQIEEFQPKFVSIESASSPERLRSLKCEILSAEELVAHPDVDLVVIAISGKAGLNPTMAAIRAKKSIALATKEVLVMAGGIITTEAKRHGAQILPIDSEPSAILQCLRGEEQRISRLILTASGGPFRHLSAEELETVSPQQALAHPTWRMGPKVTIDSATLMNKGFEAIELSWLFGVPVENIEIVIHPQSVVHSMVEFVDGSIKAQLSSPDMRLPIQYALFYPERLPNKLPHIDFSSISALTFEPPDREKFPCLRLALEAGRKGGTYPAVLSAADEVAVALFLEERIGFMNIPKLVAESLEEHQSIPNPSLEDVLAADAWARERMHR
ncbi:MAG: 1-deoxy-D-xylulose-5-phosphate reductoisomerase [Dehalococcoidia bacterium]|nr:MAG: 1-deoxy-D-xylulose-5-phosphate reductoisomerase [Dehalococcoidia bacterium]